jgi:hypothetical protein
MPTRLLDWTRNPLVAAYFAVRDEYTGDSCVYVLNSNQYIRLDKYPNPFGIEKVGKYLPRHISNRIIAQSGLFTIHPNPTVQFKSDKIDRLIISAGFRKEFKRTIYKYGIHEATLFPDIEGICRHIEWLRTDKY